MRSVNRSRALASPFLPLVLGALVLRALIPAGFMPAMGSTVLEAMMCAPGSGERTENVEIPGGSTSVHCDFCVMPTLGSAPATSLFSVSSQPHEALPSARSQAPASRFALVRVQIPRAPPA
jgi:hypothetical protein